MAAHIMHGHVILDGQRVQVSRLDALEFQEGQECQECGDPAVAHVGVWGRMPQSRNPVHVGFWLCARHRDALQRRVPVR